MPEPDRPRLVLVLERSTFSDTRIAVWELPNDEIVSDVGGNANRDKAIAWLLEYLSEPGDVAPPVPV